MAILIDYPLLMSHTKEANKEATIESMFKAGAHFGFSRSRRHPSLNNYIYGTKNKVEIINLEKTTELLDVAKDFVRKLASEGKNVLFVGGKNEAKDSILKGAQSVDMPYVAGRWIGGTLTNFSEIKGRVSKLQDLTAQKEKGELSKYTKKERLLIDRQIDNLNRFFSGLINLSGMPGALFVVDARKEHIAVAEAHSVGVPVISLCGSDNNIKEVEYPIVANDSSLSSIAFFVDEIVKAYAEGKTKA
jgi:small subunit ribosomal protein S2